MFEMRLTSTNLVACKSRPSVVRSDPTARKSLLKPSIHKFMPAANDQYFCFSHQLVGRGRACAGPTAPPAHGVRLALGEGGTYFHR